MLGLQVLTLHVRLLPEFWGVKLRARRIAEQALLLNELCSPALGSVLAFALRQGFSVGPRYD